MNGQRPPSMCQFDFLPAATHLQVETNKTNTSIWTAFGKVFVIVKLLQLSQQGRGVACFDDCFHVESDRKSLMCQTWVVTLFFF